jgi:4-hydroxy-tetrahydrodipicolinate synthase
MTVTKLQGVIAAIPTPVSPDGAPDHRRLIAFAERLLADGCHGLNLLGTTGEATSFDVATRRGVMSSFGDRDDLLGRMMVGTGAAAGSDAANLLRHADGVGFTGALILPSFYYKGLSQAGIADWISVLIDRAAPKRVRIYLYNFPQMTGLTYGKDCIDILRRRHGALIAGLKDSSGDLAYAEDLVRAFPGFDVFPSNEAVLANLQVKGFAGCISASVNASAVLSRAVHDNPESAYANGITARMQGIRALLSSYPLVPAVKAAVGIQTGDPLWSRTIPPLSMLDPDQMASLKERLAPLMAA